MDAIVNLQKQAFYSAHLNVELHVHKLKKILFSF